jgi:hypothetical protein
MEDTARAANTAAASLENLYTAFKKFADSNLTAPIEGAAAVLSALGSDGADTLMNVLGYGAAGIGALVLGRKAYKGARGLASMFGGKGGGAGGVASGLGGLPLPLPVYVVNSKMSLLPGELGGWASLGGAGKTGRALGKRGGKLGRALSKSDKWMGRAGGLVSAGLAAYDLYNAWSDSDASTAEKVAATGGAVGQGLGGWGGAAAGAALGSMILPGIGTAIGAALGGWGGSMGGEWAGSGLGSLFSGLFDDGTEKRRAELERAERASGARESAKAELAITVTDDRVKVRRVSSHGYDDISVDSGAYMPGVGR